MQFYNGTLFAKKSFSTISEVKNTEKFFVRI